MARGFPDWGAVATTAGAELPTYATKSGVLVPSDGSRPYPAQWLNPAGSNKLVGIYRISLIVFSRRLGDEEGLIELDLRQMTSLGAGGISVTPFPLDSTNAAAVLQSKEIAAVPGGMGSTLPNFVGVYASHDRYPHTRQDHPVNLEYDLYRHAAASQQQPLTLRPGEGLVLNDAAPAVDHYLAITMIHTEKPL